MSDEKVWGVGDYVVKAGGDYRFHGYVVAAFAKRSGQRRYVVENADGVLHIFRGSQLITSKEAGRFSGVDPETSGPR